MVHVVCIERSDMERSPTTNGLKPFLDKLTWTVTLIIWWVSADASTHLPKVSTNGFDHLFHQQLKVCGFRWTHRRTDLMFLSKWTTWGQDWRTWNSWAQILSNKIIIPKSHLPSIHFVSYSKAAAQIPKKTLPGSSGPFVKPQGMGPSSISHGGSQLVYNFVEPTAWPTRRQLRRQDQAVLLEVFGEGKGGDGWLVVSGWKHDI